jgi:hypothetical protein
MIISLIVIALILGGLFFLYICYEAPTDHYDEDEDDDVMAI